MAKSVRSDEAAFSLVELLVALTILALVIVTSLGIFLDRQKRLLLAAENMQAYQAIANEAEFQKHRSYDDYRRDAEEEFSTLHPTDPSEDTIVDALKNVHDRVVAHEASPGVMAVTMTLSWGDPKEPHVAAMTILRTRVQLW